MTFSLDEYRARRDLAELDIEPTDEDREILKPIIIAWCEERLGHPLGSLEPAGPGSCVDCDDAQWLSEIAGGQPRPIYEHERRWKIGRLELCRVHARSRMRAALRLAEQEAA